MLSATAQPSQALPILSIPMVEAAMLSEPPATPSVADILASTSAVMDLTLFQTQRVKDIAFCESGTRQFKDDGSLVIGPTGDIGVMQISPIHESEALKRGFDINTVQGNVSYGIILYKANGSVPWNSSRECWSRSPARW